MSLKKCENCGEMVDAAKAFCPGCGDPFVEEEKREESSEFDKYAGTMNITKSVYNMMLTEMELDTSTRPVEKVIQPEKQEPVVPAEMTGPPNPAPAPAVPPPLTKNPGKSKRVIIFAVMIILIPLAALTVYLFVFSGTG